MRQQPPKQRGSYSQTTLRDVGKEPLWDINLALPTPEKSNTMLTITYKAQDLQLAPHLTHSRTRTSKPAAQPTQTPLTFLGGAGQPLHQRPPGSVKLPSITLPSSAPFF